MPIRRILLFTVAMACILVWTLISPMAERSDRLKQTPGVAIGASDIGYKGLFQLLETVQKQPISLWEHSMMRMPEHGSPQTIWFIDPNEDLFFDGKAYSEHMQALVQQGSHMVFVLGENPNRQVLDFLNKWYHLSVRTKRFYYDPTQPLTVHSRFPSRQISTLQFVLPATDDTVFSKPPHENNPFKTAI